MTETSAPLFSVIIPCLYESDELTRCLQSVTQQQTGFPFEVVVVNSGLSQGIQDVAATFPEVRTVNGSGVMKAGEARNFGASCSHGRFLSFIDSDCEAQDGWLAEALAGLMSGGRLVGGPVTHARPFQPIRVADNMLQFSDFAPGRPNGQGDHFPSCNIAISRSDFDEVGGFPFVHFSACEDVLFSKKANEAWNDGLLFQNGMRVKHLGRGRLGAFWRHQEQFGLCRGALGLNVLEIHRRLGKSAWCIIPVMLKRLSYVLSRSVRWNRKDLLMAIPLFPILLFGLTGWAVGFRKGCRSDRDFQPRWSGKSPK